MKKRICGLLSLLLALSLCGCGGSTQTESGTALALYFLSAEAGSGSIYNSDSTLTVDTDDCEEAARQLVNALLDGPELPTQTSPFPTSVRLLNCELSGGVLTLNFSEEYGTLSGSALTAANYSLVLTLCQLDEVDGVLLLLEGSALPNGPSGVLTPDQATLRGPVSDPVTFAVQLYFPNADGTGLEADYRELTVFGTASKTWCIAILEALCVGSSDYSVFPEASFTSADVSVSQGVCEVQLPDSWTECILQNGDLWQESIVESLCQVDGVNAVRFHTSDATTLDGQIFYPQENTEETG
ncbi:MAG: GerMN domain-containing protein [Clostridiales bacterium]|nr:GerMN domain-containing protein [Clostridiales bacterium]